MWDDTVDKYNNAVHKTIKIKSIDITADSFAKYMKIETKKILNLKLLTMLEFQNSKKILLKDILQIGQKKFLLLATLKIQFLGLMLLMIRMVQKLLDVFTKKNCGKLIKKNLK